MNNIEIYVITQHNLNDFTRYYQHLSKRFDHIRTVIINTVKKLIGRKNSYVSNEDILEALGDEESYKGIIYYNHPYPPNINMTSIEFRFRRKTNDQKIDMTNYHIPLFWLNMSDRQITRKVRDAISYKKKELTPQEIEELKEKRAENNMAMRKLNNENKLIDIKTGNTSKYYSRKKTYYDYEPFYN